MRAVATAIVVALANDARACDLDLGRYLAAECLTCHRPAAGATIPALFGRPEATLVGLLRAYRSGERTNPVMQTIARRLSDAEVAALGCYFANTKQP
jgi:cytochrome c